MTRILYAITVVAVLLLFSCEHKELCDSHSHTSNVEVIFDWIHAPEANPETMRLYLFPNAGGSAQMYEFTDKNGGVIKIPNGTYKAVCVNSDTESIIYRNVDSFEFIEAFTSPGALILGSHAVPRVEGTEGERVSKSPDKLYSDHHKEVIVKDTKEDQTITLYPESSVCRYRVTVLNVSNLKYVPADGISGALTGMSGGLLLAPNRLTPERNTIPFSVTSDGISTINAEFLTFGQTDVAGSLHKLVIYVILADGTKNYYTFDVTAQVDGADNPRDVHIVLDGLPLPKPIVNGGGFQPSVDDWDNIEVDVPM